MILIADPDSQLAESLSQEAQASPTAPPLLFALTGKEAHDLLGRTDQALSAIFVNPRVSHPSGLTVIRYAHQFRPGVPIHLIHDEPAPPFNIQELQRLGIQHVLAKPVRLAQILAAARPGAAQADSPGEAATDEAHPHEASCFAVRADLFTAGTKSSFDLYLRLPSARFVKILNAGESLSEERIRNYLSKGVVWFHARREEQERYLTHCDELLSTVLKNPVAPVELKVTQTMRYGEETLRFLRTSGLGDAQLQHAANFVDQVNQLVSQLNVNKNALFKAFFSSLGACEHGAGVAIVASMLAPQLKLPPDSSVRIVGMAAMFHDIGLLQLPPEVQDEDESRMSEEQKTLFRTHPAVGAQILRATQIFDPAVAEAISQHHERLVQGKGFQSSIGALTDVAEIIGIADEFVRLIQKKKAFPRLNPLEQMEREVFEGFSSPVVDGFRRVFFLTLL